jgi:hypothetical protein
MASDTWSSFLRWWRVSFHDFSAMFTWLQPRRPIIHDQAYLEKITEAGIQQMTKSDCSSDARAKAATLNS